MNTRFTFAFIRHLHTRSQGGFALAVALCVGLAVLIVGATMMIRAQGDQTKVVSQTAKTIANAAAEAGLTRVINFVQTNPAAATYNMESWSNATLMTAAVTQTTEPVSVSFDTVNTTNFCSLPDSSTPSGSTSTTAKVANITTAVAQMSASNGQALNSSDGSAMSPRYQLKQYLYDASNGTAQVQIIGQAGSLAKTSVVATIPVTKNNASVTLMTTNKLPAAFPSLWVNGNGGAKSNLNSVYTDVIGPCAAVGNVISTTVTNNTFNTNKESKSFRYIQTPQAMPVSPIPPTTDIRNLGENVPDGTSLPLDADISAATKTNYVGGRYQYKVDKIQFNGNGVKLSFKAGYKVSLYEKGSIEPDTADIAHPCGTNTNCNATDAMIIGSSASTDPNIRLQGNGSVCNVFVWASTYAVELSGGGGGSTKCATPPNSNGRVDANNTGFYWVKSFQGTSSPSANQNAISDQDSTLWPNSIAVVNALIPDSIPLTSSTTATYTKIALGQVQKYATIAADQVITSPSP